MIRTIALATAISLAAAPAAAKPTDLSNLFELKDTESFMSNTDVGKYPMHSPFARKTGQRLSDVLGEPMAYVGTYYQRWDSAGRFHVSAWDSRVLQARHDTTAFNASSKRRFTYKQARLLVQNVAYPEKIQRRPWGLRVTLPDGTGMAAVISGKSLALVSGGAEVAAMRRAARYILRVTPKVLSRNADYYTAHGTEAFAWGVTAGLNGYPVVTKTKPEHFSDEQLRDIFESSISSDTDYAEVLKYVSLDYQAGKCLAVTPKPGSTAPPVYLRFTTKRGALPVTEMKNGTCPQQA